jgi:hypothetical protein
MDLASGFAQPSLACAEQIWEWALYPASVSKPLFSMDILAEISASGDRRKQTNRTSRPLQAA